MSKAGRSHRIYCRRCRATVDQHEARLIVRHPTAGWTTVLGLCLGCYAIVMRQIENRRLVR